MGYLSEEKLQEMGFKSLGTNVKISDRASMYNTDQIEIGDNSRIDDFCVVSGKISIGRHVHIAPLCLVAGGTEGIKFSDFSGLAYHAQVFTQSDDYTGNSLTNPTVPTKYKSEHKASVSLGKHVIVGAGSIVFPGVQLAEGCSIGAMSLVNKSTEAWGMYVGCPAKRVKERSQELLKLEQEFLVEESRHDTI